MLKNYDTVVIFKTDVTEEYVGKITTKLEKVLKAKPGKINEKKDWGNKTLAYEIKKEKQGRYVFWNYTQDPSVVEKVEKVLRYEENILRYSTIIQSEAEIKVSRALKADKDKNSNSLVITYKEPMTLTKFVSDRGKIVPRRVSGVNAVAQRRISREIKRARQLALMGFVSNFPYHHGASQQNQSRES
ncbi:MAG: 30S ribosomal protein S18 [Bdellovibrionales bacterium]|nr:30S ribosomal protein S18 [Bdellovibrionales bacterium]